MPGKISLLPGEQSAASVPPGHSLEGVGAAAVKVWMEKALEFGDESGSLPHLARAIHLPHRSAGIGDTVEQQYQCGLATPITPAVGDERFPLIEQPV